MDFSVEPDVFAHFPGMRLAVVVARDVDNQRDPPPIAHGRDFGASARRFVVDAATPRISW